MWRKRLARRCSSEKARPSFVGVFAVDLSRAPRVFHGVESGYKR